MIITAIIIHQIYSPAKIGKYPGIFPNFQNHVCYDAIACIGRKRMFGNLSLDIICSGKFTVALSENCSLPGTDNACGQIRTRNWKKWKLFTDYSDSDSSDLIYMTLLTNPNFDFRSYDSDYNSDWELVRR